MQITIRQFVKELQNALAQTTIQTSVQLGKGQCATLEDYKTKVGFIKGLDGASEMAGSMLRNLEDQVRDAEDSLPEMPQIPPQVIGKGKGK